MTDTRRVLAQICDLVTESLLTQGPQLLPDALRNANTALVTIREKAQDELGRLMQEEP